MHLDAVLFVYAEGESAEEVGTAITNKGFYWKPFPEEAMAYRKPITYEQAEEMHLREFVETGRYLPEGLQLLNSVSIPRNITYGVEVECAGKCKALWFACSSR